MKRTGIPVKGVRVKDGKLQKVTIPRDASHQIAIRKSKRVRVVKKGTGT